MKKLEFWKWFDNFAAPNLLHRETSFRKIFQYLDAFEEPVTIVETGCIRTPGYWCDGQSTILFEHYAMHNHADAIVHSVDLDEKAVKACRAMVGNHVHLHHGDSVAILAHLAKRLNSEKRTIDLLYLDSFDVDWHNPIPSAVHHLKELVSIVGAITQKTLVVVDDCGIRRQVYVDGNNNWIAMDHVAKPIIAGKGMYIAEYAEQVDAKLVFSHYQAAWINMVQS